jgi:chromate transporter
VSATTTVTPAPGNSLVSTDAAGVPVTLGALVRYFLYLGTFVFGGPVVLVERMRRDLQESRGWFTEREYRDGLGLA